MQIDSSLRQRNIREMQEKVMSCHFPADDLSNLLTLSYLWLKVMIGLVKGLPRGYKRVSSL